jgi:hypothetical protein
MLDDLPAVEVRVHYAQARRAALRTRPWSAERPRMRAIRARP